MQRDATHRTSFLCLTHIGKYFHFNSKLVNTYLDFHYFCEKNTILFGSLLCSDWFWLTLWFRRKNIFPIGSKNSFAQRGQRILENAKNQQETLSSIQLRYFFAGKNQSRKNIVKNSFRKSQHVVMSICSFLYSSYLPPLSSLHHS